MRECAALKPPDSCATSHPTCSTCWLYPRSYWCTFSAVQISGARSTTLRPQRRLRFFSKTGISLVILGLLPGQGQSSAQMRLPPWLLLLLHGGASAIAVVTVRRTLPSVPPTRCCEVRAAAPVDSKSYSQYWEKLLQQEYREAASELRERRSKWSRARLEASGVCVFDASATPESDLYGEKVVRVHKAGETRLADRFTRGDILVLGPDSRAPSWSSASSEFVPRECCVVDRGPDWLTIGVGQSWPTGLWEARRRPGSFGVMLHRTCAAPNASTRAPDCQTKPQSQRHDAGQLPRAAKLSSCLRISRAIASDPGPLHLIPCHCI